MDKIETTRHTDVSFVAFPIVSCCYICDTPVQYGRNAEDFPKYTLICRKCKEAILWAREKMEEQDAAD